MIHSQNQTNTWRNQFSIRSALNEARERMKRRRGKTVCLYEREWHKKERGPILHHQRYQTKMRVLTQRREKHRHPCHGVNAVSLPRVRGHPSCPWKGKIDTGCKDTRSRTEPRCRWAAARWARSGALSLHSCPVLTPASRCHDAGQTSGFVPPHGLLIGQASFNLHPSGGLKASPKLPSDPTRRARQRSRRSTARDGAPQLPQTTGPHRRVLSHRLAPFSTIPKLQNHTDQRSGSAGGSLHRRPVARSGPSSPRLLPSSPGAAGQPSL